MAKPLNYRIVVKMIGQQADDDIIMSHDAKAEECSSLTIGQVKEMGYYCYQDSKIGDGRIEVKVGDMVYLTPYTGRIIPKKDGSYERIITDNDIQGLVEEDDDIDCMVGNVVDE